MNYTIATLEDVQGIILVDFSRDGSNYVVTMLNTYTHECTSKRFDNIDNAYSVFEKLSKAIITGCYSYEQRKEFLK